MKNLLLTLILCLTTLSLFAQQNGKDEFSGIYTFKNAPVQSVEITKENNTLFAYAEEVGKLTLSSTSLADVYAQADHQATIKFLRDKTSGQVIGVLLSVQGQDYEGEKLGAGLEDYEGTYQLENLGPEGKLTVRLNKGKLELESALGVTELERAEKKDAFNLVAASGMVQFKRAADGKIRGIAVDYAGNSYVGEKL
jgi:hypothetical protein